MPVPAENTCLGTLPSSPRRGWQPRSITVRTSRRMKWPGNPNISSAAARPLRQAASPRHNARSVGAFAQRRVTSPAPSLPRGSSGVQTSAGAFDVDDAARIVITLACPHDGIATLIRTFTSAVLDTSATTVKVATVVVIGRLTTCAALVAVVVRLCSGSRGLREGDTVSAIAARWGLIVTVPTASTAILIGTVTPSTTDIINSGATIITAAIVTIPSVRTPPLTTALTRAPGWPSSSVLSFSWPLPCPPGSLPDVLVAVVACGVVVIVERSTPPTGGGADGTTLGGVLDERRAAAIARTTAEDLTSPLPRDVNGNAGGIRVTILLLTTTASSLLPTSDVTKAASRSSSNSGGRRGSSGQPLRTDLTSTGSLTPPTTAGLRRAALRHLCRSAAGALAPSPVTPLRVATATLLTSSKPPQLGWPSVTGRAGERRTAERNQPPLEAAKTLRATPQRLASAPSANSAVKVIDRQTIGVAVGGAQGKLHHGGPGNKKAGKYMADAITGGALWPTPRAPPGTTGGDSRLGHQCCRTAPVV